MRWGMPSIGIHLHMWQALSSHLELSLDLFCKLTQLIKCCMKPSRRSCWAFRGSCSRPERQEKGGTPHAEFQVVLDHRKICLSHYSITNCVLPTKDGMKGRKGLELPVGCWLSAAVHCFAVARATGWQLFYQSIQGVLSTNFRSCIQTCEPQVGCRHHDLGLQAP